MKPLEICEIADQTAKILSDVDGMNDVISVIKLMSITIKDQVADNKRDAVERMNTQFYISSLENKIAELEKPKLCGTCTHDWCGCSVQDSIRAIEPEVRFDTFGCVHHENP